MSKFTVHVEPSLTGHPLRQNVFDILAAIPDWIAPEREPDASVQTIQIRVRDQPSGRNACCSPSSGEIEFDSGFIDALWCIAASSFLFQREYDAQAAQKDLTKTPLEFSLESPEVRHAFALFESFLRLWSDGEALDWTTVPQIHEELRGSFEHLLRSALGFVLLHEIGHITCGHDGSVDLETSREMEHDADNFALDCLFRGLDNSDPEKLAFRGWGVVVATMAMCAAETRRNTTVEAMGGTTEAVDVVNRTHPLPFTRLERVLKHERVEEFELVRGTLYNAAFVPLYLHTFVLGAVPSQEGKEFADPADLFEFLMNELHDQLARISGG